MSRKRLCLAKTCMLLAATMAPALGLSQEPQAEPKVLALEDNMCIVCHGESDLWEGDTAHLHVPTDSLTDTVHWQKGVQCHHCHGGNPESTELREAHASESGFQAIEKPLDQSTFCGRCHDQQLADLLRSDHKAAGQPNAQGVAGAMSCAVCHSEGPHAIRAVDDMSSPVFVQNQVALCGKCHEHHWEEYRVSVHGRGLEHSGLLMTAVCANCHGAHAVLKAENPESSLHETHVAHTCGACHRFIEERLLQSVHGRGNGPGVEAETTAPGGVTHRKPTCTDCHAGHDLPDPRSAVSRNRQGDRCGNCHTELQTAYRMSMHGALSDLGYTAGAKCSDCHGSHSILAIADPASTMSIKNRIATCSSCHPGISDKLVSFDPHANHRDSKRSALVFWVYRGVLTFIIVVFGFFGIHSVFWFVRGVVDVIKNGRPKTLAPNVSGYVRFKPFHRVAHTIMVVSFLGLALTGLPLKFSNYLWAQWLAAALGGFASTGLWHRIFSITTFGCFGAYVLLLLWHYRLKRQSGATRLETVFGPDSPVPNLRDAKDMLAMAKWFIGRGPRPTFERWAYWEKFDFFGASSDIILIGTTGLILWFPNFFCLFLPGEAVNVAKIVHSTLALLATGFVFAIHFFGTHFRADKFPMDMSILTGMVSETEMEHERPELLARLRAEGRLEESQMCAPERGKLCGVRIAGFVALFVGLAALAGIIWSLLV